MCNGTKCSLHSSEMGMSIQYHMMLFFQFTLLQTLLNIQKKIIRLMTFRSYLEHTEPLFKELNILDIFKTNDNLTAIFMF